MRVLLASSAPQHRDQASRWEAIRLQQQTGILDQPLAVGEAGLHQVLDGINGIGVGPNHPFGHEHGVKGRGVALDGGETRIRPGRLDPGQADCKVPI